MRVQCSTAEAGGRSPLAARARPCGMEGGSLQDCVIWVGGRFLEGQAKGLIQLRRPGASTCPRTNAARRDAIDCRDSSTSKHETRDTLIATARPRHAQARQGVAAVAVVGQPPHAGPVAKSAGKCWQVHVSNSHRVRISLPPFTPGCSSHRTPTGTSAAKGDDHQRVDVSRPRPRLQYCSSRPVLRELGCPTGPVQFDSASRLQARRRPGRTQS